MSDFVPARFVPGFVAIRLLDEPAAGDLIKAVQQAPGFLSLTELASVVAEGLPEAVRSDSPDIVNSLLSLRGQLRVERSLDSLLDDVTGSGAIGAVTPEERQVLAERLRALLQADAIVTTAGAADVLIDHERPFHSARAFTDIRPVFSDDPAKSPRGAAIVVNLHLNYWNASGAHNSLSFGLDESDVRSLKEVLDRAIEKSTTLRRMLEDVGIAAFSTEGSGKATSHE